MNKIEKLTEIIKGLDELMQHENNEQHDNVFFEVRHQLFKVCEEEKEIREKEKDLRVFNVDYKGQFLTTVKAKNEKEAEEIACKQYPNISHSLQVWELGASLRETKGELEK